jgi:hypothetical protein
VSFLNYTKDVNDEIKELDPETQELLDEFSNHSNIGIELRYALTQRWKLKLGIGSENLLSPWKISYSTVILEQPIQLDYERSYQLINTYIGANFSLWQNPDVYDIYLGLDIGSTLLRSGVKSSVEGIDEPTSSDETFEYNEFSWKFALGGIYFLSSRFSLGLEMGLKGGGKFDTSDQFEDIGDGSGGITREVDSGGLQLVIFVGYHF